MPQLADPGSMARRLRSQRNSSSTPPAARWGKMRDQVRPILNASWQKELYDTVLYISRQSLYTVYYTVLYYNLLRFTIPESLPGVPPSKVTAKHIHVRRGSYFLVFQNTAHADHSYAANCVPAQMCAELRQQPRRQPALNPKRWLS